MPNVDDKIDDNVVIKKLLKEVTLSKPELLPEIERLRTFKFGDEDMLKILKKFEE